MLGLVQVVPGPHVSYPIAQSVLMQVKVALGILPGPTGWYPVQVYVTMSVKHLLLLPVAHECNLRGRIIFPK